MGERVTRGLVYSPERGLKLDLHQPFRPGPHPLVVAVHGGYWKYGERTQLDAYWVWLVRRGYAVASIDYSPAYPAALEDLTQAIRFLRQSASRWGLDGGRIALLGLSSGGHLVSLAALDSKLGVQAVIDLYGPTDLTAPPMAEDTIVREVFGSNLRQASPLHRLAGPTPPFLIVHGDCDRVVPFQQSKAWHQRLLETGNQATLLPVRHAGHDLVAVGGQPEPSRFQVARRIGDFLDQTLSKGAK